MILEQRQMAWAKWAESEFEHKFSVVDSPYHFVFHFYCTVMLKFASLILYNKMLKCGSLVSELPLAFC